MIVIVIVLVLIIVGGIGLLLKIKLNNKKTAIESKQNKQAIMEQIRATKVPSSKPEEEEQIEVLELYPEDSLKKVEVSEDTLDLNDLFKTISMKAIEDNQKFDFGLQRSEEK